jgi:hypothetical protein
MYNTFEKKKMFHTIICVFVYLSVDYAMHVNNAVLSKSILSYVVMLHNGALCCPKETLFSFSSWD